MIREEGVFLELGGGGFGRGGPETFWVIRRDTEWGMGISMGGVRRKVRVIAGRIRGENWPAGSLPNNATAIHVRGIRVGHFNTSGVDAFLQTLQGPQTTELPPMLPRSAQQLC